jgi:hypothetical protein
VAITAKVVADMLTTVGVNRVMVMDLHADQIQGFFNIPVDNIYATPILLGDLWKQNYEDLLVVSPDVGGVVRAARIAKRLDSDLAIIDKRRPKANVSEVMNIIGDVDGRICVIMDDLADTANTLCKAASALKERGAKKVVAYCTHPVLSGGAGRAHRDVGLGRGGRDRHYPLTVEAEACFADPPAVLRPIAGRDDDPYFERRVGELAVHGLRARAARRGPARGDPSNCESTSEADATMPNTPRAKEAEGALQPRPTCPAKRPRAPSHDPLAPDWGIEL